MSENYINQSGSNKSYADNRGGSTLYSHPIVGIVKNNIDLYKSGKIQVYLKRQNLPNQDNPLYWTTVSYMSPFFGNTPNTGSPDSPGNYVGNPNSYGFWATPPDIGTEVVCIFVNGDPNSGYYIGCLPQPAATHMVPAISAGSNVIPNEGESVGYGGATNLPLSEYNTANDKQDNSPLITESPRPIHSYQAAILNAQGLIRDPIRGVITSSSMRESPSRVFGMSTPGRPIYDGGYTDETISSAVSSDGTPQSYKVIGRRGGHSIVMDDGDLVGNNQLTRIRTAGGHMIMMNDTAQTLCIIHANGSSYIELGKEGTIDMYSTNSVNIRTQGDLNLHADNNININAKKDLNISSKNLHIESIEETTQFVGTAFKQYTKGNHTVKVDSKMTLASAGDSMIKSGGTNFIKGGPKVHLNTGESSLVPENVKQIPIIAHTDTLRDSEKGYAPAPCKLPSIVSRAPAHMPWVNANQGVNVKTDLSADANLPPAPPKSVVQTNQSVAATRITPTTPATAATVPQNPATTADTNNLGATDALVSQAAVNAAAGPAASAIAGGAGVVSVDGVKSAALGNMAMNPTQLVKAGVLKPGSDVTVNSLIQQGKSIATAMPTNVFTGKDGINSVAAFVNSPTSQTKTMNTLLGQGKTALTNANLITGKESLTQTGGLLLASALQGPGPVTDFVKQASSGQTGIIPSVDALKNSLTGSIESTIKSGNFAANLADKSTGALGGIDVGESLKGAAAGAFSKITGTYKNLKANVPQRLTGPSESTDAKDVAETASANLGGIVPGFNPSAVPVPGGLGAITNIVKAGGESITGAAGSANLSKDIKSLTSSISSGLSDIKSKINGLSDSLKSKGDLTSTATAGLPKGVASELQGAIASLGAGGSVKAPTVALDTNNITGLLEQNKALLGNPKIPPINLGNMKIPTTPMPAEKTMEYDAIKKEVETLDDLKFDYRREYLNALRDSGKDSQQAQEWKTKYEDTLKKIEELNNKLKTLAIG